MKSINSGLNWSIIDLNYKDSLYINRIRIPSPNVIYISSGDTPAKLFRTTNGGVNWNMSGFDNIEALTDFEFSDELHGAACGYGGFRYFTVDGGLNWTYQRLPDTTKFILDICLAGDTYINTGGTGWIERSTNCGINWISLSSNFTSDRLNSVSFGDKETGLITGNSSTILRTTNRGLNWQKIELKDPQVLTDVKMASKNIAYLTSGNNVMKSTNGGMNWFVVLDSVGRGYRNIALYDSNNVIVSTFNFLYKTSNGGASWSLVWGCYNLPPFYTSCFFINEISYPAADLIVMAGGTAQQYTYSTATVMKSTNGGLNFTIAFDEVSEGYVLNSLQMIDENLGFASGGFGLFLRTTDGFSTYTNLGNTKNGYGSFEMMSFLDSANGLAGTGPLFRTTNSGINWELSTDIYGSLGDIQYISKDHAIAVGYDGSIVIMAPALNGTGDPPVIPNRFYLYQNFPNPFNPATKIRFELVESGNTTLILYDITGREVRVLLNGFRAAGIYQTEHVFDDLASGVYFVTLRQGSYTMSRKLALIK